MELGMEMGEWGWGWDGGALTEQSAEHREWSQAMGSPGRGRGIGMEMGEGIKDGNGSNLSSNLEAGGSMSPSGLPAGTGRAV
jgi:hypothetical protein